LPKNKSNCHLLSIVCPLFNIVSVYARRRRREESFPS
jgi:hypothetical protein